MDKIGQQILKENTNKLKSIYKQLLEECITGIKESYNSGMRVYSYIVPVNPMIFDATWSMENAYAASIYIIDALREKKYKCFLKKPTTILILLPELAISDNGIRKRVVSEYKLYEKYMDSFKKNQL